jgi:Tetrapyrrole (Corrin/Porphyrin) Methylases
MPAEAKGSLVVVGTGYLVGGQMTAEARAHVEKAERFFHLVGDPVTRHWLASLNPRGESLYDSYAPGKPRMDTYREMVDRILAPVRRGEAVCAAFYGHPGVGAFPGHAAIRQARLEGHQARMLPGVSAEDCLFADLGLDPLAAGCQSFEATRFLVRRHRPDPTVPLILWQIGVIGQAAYSEAPLWNRGGLAVLAEVLSGWYPAGHECVVYEAAMLPVCDPLILRVPLAELPAAAVTTASTLYVPPAGEAPVDPEMAARLKPATA